MTDSELEQRIQDIIALKLEEITGKQFDDLVASHPIRTAKQVWSELGGKAEENACAMLTRLMKRCPDFPRPRTLGPGGRGWIFLFDEVMAWVRSQPSIESVRTKARGLS